MRTALVLSLLCLSLASCSGFQVKTKAWGQYLDYTRQLEGRNKWRRESGIDPVPPITYEEWAGRDRDLVRQDQQFDRVREWRTW